MESNESKNIGDVKLYSIKHRERAQIRVQHERNSHRSMYSFSDMLKKFYNVLDKSTTAIKHEESVAQKLFQCIDTLEDITYNTIDACNEDILPQVSPPSKIQSIYSSFRNRLNVRT